MRTLFLLIFLGVAGNISVPSHAKSKPRGGQNYYVDAQNGDDRADGKRRKDGLEKPVAERKKYN